MTSATAIKARPTGVKAGTVQNYGTTTGRKSIAASVASKKPFANSSVVFILVILAVVIYLEG